MDKYPEIFIGMVAPIGSGENKEDIQKYLKERFNYYNYEFVRIKITDLIFKEDAFKNVPESYKYYLKMELCSKIREKYGNGYLAALAAKKIIELRENKDPEKGIVFFIDQIKNTGEYDILSNLYDINYIQISCSSSKLKRNSILENFFSDRDIGKIKNRIKEENIFHNKRFRDLLDKDKIFEEYEQKTLPDASFNLLAKDFNEAQSKDKKKYGQQIADIFHESHYFINLDKTDKELKEQAVKFIDLLFGRYEEYPTQDEFGMALAQTAAMRSNFPGDRQVGACIISECGEVISTGSIRSPSPCSNPSKADQSSVTKGYKTFKNQITENIKFLEEREKCSEKQEEHKFKNIIKYLEGTLDFHPSTHAEMAAICDAAKVGVPLRGATLYTTVFPCHICAKDIISSGIKKVVFCEAFPKSKNEELYSEVLEIDPEAPHPKKVPFYTFSGVGPKRYGYVFHLKGKVEKEEKNKDKEDNFIPPFLQYRTCMFYRDMEKCIVRYLENSNLYHPFWKGLLK